MGREDEPTPEIQVLCGKLYSGFPFEDGNEATHLNDDWTTLGEAFLKAVKDFFLLILMGETQVSIVHYNPKLTDIETLIRYKDNTIFLRGLDELGLELNKELEQSERHDIIKSLKS